MGNDRPPIAGVVGRGTGLFRLRAVEHSQRMVDLPCRSTKLEHHRRNAIAKASLDKAWHAKHKEVKFLLLKN
jgi:hypothetical protein